MATLFERISEWNRRMNGIPRRLWLIAVVLLVCSAVIWLLPYVWPFVLAMLLAAILEPVARLLRKALKKTKAARIIATLLCMLLLFGLLTLGIMAISSRVVREAANLLRATPDLARSLYNVLIEKANQLYADYQHLLPENFLEVANNALNSITSSVISFAGSLSTRVAGATINTATSLPIAILTFIFTVMGTFYFSYDRERIVGYFRETIPEPVMNHFRLIRDGVFSALFGQIKAQIFISFVLMLIIIAGLAIMGEPYALLLGVLIGIADVLPVLGAGLFLNTWAIVEIIVGNYYTALGLFIIYLVCVIVRQIIEPRIVGKQLGLHPLLTMLSMYVGYKVIGALGLIAGPLVANICRVVLDADAGKLQPQKAKPLFPTLREQFAGRRNNKKKEK